MKVVNIDKEVYLSTTFFDPSPHRFRPDDAPVVERKIPILYRCEKCETEISIKTGDFEKHFNSDFTNLDEEDNKNFAPSIKEVNKSDLSFLDFYCPKCNQPTKILFRGGPSGYWGEFSFSIEDMMVLKT